MINSIERTSGVSNGIKGLLKSNCFWTENRVKVIWKNETEALPATHGLELAHYLGLHFWKDFKKPDNENSFVELMKKAGYMNYSANMNILLTKKMDTNLIQEWERNTGLKYQE